MSPTPMSPINKQAQPTRAASHDSTDGIRKRVCKACDRCRLKKSKCDGSSPCSRCKADNAICVFGERKRSQDKIYPKGYVEMLEQQQSQLVSGLKEMYHRLQTASAWDGPNLDESSGHPLTHDILSALDLLESKHDDSGEVEAFEENCDKLQSRMISEGASLAHRRGSISSESDHSHHERPRTASSRHETPVQPKLALFKESFNFPSATSSPLTQSPISIPRSKTFDQHQQHIPAPVRPSPLQQPHPTFINDPQLYAPEWAQALAEMNDPDQVFRNKYSDYDAFNSPWEQAQMPSLGDSYNHYPSFQNPMAGGNMFGVSDITDLPQLDSMDFDFSKFVQQPEVMT